MNIVYVFVAVDLFLRNSLSYFSYYWNEQRKNQVLCALRRSHHKTNARILKIGTEYVGAYFLFMVSVLLSSPLSVTGPVGDAGLYCVQLGS